MTTHYFDRKIPVSRESGSIPDAEPIDGEYSSECAEMNSTQNAGDRSLTDYPENSQPVMLSDLTPGIPVACALRKLARAFQFSVDCDRTKWDFAVEIKDLDTLGVSHDELRWMIGKGLVEQARETGDGQGISRSFDSPGSFTFSDSSCFVVTSIGLQMAVDMSGEIEDDLGSTVSPDLPKDENKDVPTWDDQRHELRLGDVLVKRFKWRASNQEAILAAFHEEGWPARIDDPLSPVPETDPKRRLSDTIKCLNRKQQNPVIRFSGDGTGEGVLWDRIELGT